MAEVSFDYALPLTNFSKLGTPKGEWTFDQDLPDEALRVRGQLGDVPDEVLATLRQAVQEKWFLRLRLNSEIVGPVDLLEGRLTDVYKEDEGLVTFKMWAMPEQAEHEHRRDSTS